VVEPVGSNDGDMLTRIVVLAHDRMLRVEVEAVACRFLALLIHQRKTREGSISQRCPTLDGHVEMLRQHYPRMRDLPREIHFSDESSAGVT